MSKITTKLCGGFQPCCALSNNRLCAALQCAGGNNAKNIFCAKILRSQFWVGFLKSVRYNNHKRKFFELCSPLQYRRGKAALQKMCCV